MYMHHVIMGLLCYCIIVLLFVIVCYCSCIEFIFFIILYFILFYFILMPKRKIETQIEYEESFKDV